MKKKKRMKMLAIVVRCRLVVGLGSVFNMNAYVKGSAAERIITSEEVAN